MTPADARSATGPLDRAKAPCQFRSTSRREVAGRSRRQCVGRSEQSSLLGSTTAGDSGARTSYVDTGRVKLFAEGFSLFVNHPAVLLNIRPNIRPSLTHIFP